MTELDERATTHPKFSPAAGSETEPVTVRKTVDTGAARERITTSRATKEDRAPRPAPRSTRTEKAAEPAPAYKAGMYRAPVAAAYTQIGGALAYIAYPLGITIQEQANPCADAWEAVAKDSPAVRRWLTNMTKGSAYGSLMVAHLPIFMTALMLFGPDSVKERFGVVVGDSFERTNGVDPQNTP